MRDGTSRNRTLLRLSRSRGTIRVAAVVAVALLLDARAAWQLADARAADGETGIARTAFGTGQSVLPVREALERVATRDAVKDLTISPVYLPGFELAGLPMPKSLEKLLLANYLEACSETCVFNANEAAPSDPAFAWNGDDVDFLRNFDSSN